jgi:hypothetical protein
MLSDRPSPTANWSYRTELFSPVSRVRERSLSRVGENPRSDESIAPESARIDQAIPTIPMIWGSAPMAGDTPFGDVEADRRSAWRQWARRQTACVR